MPTRKIMPAASASLHTCPYGGPTGNLDEQADGVAARCAGHGAGAGGARPVRRVGEQPGRLSAHALGPRRAGGACAAGHHAGGPAPARRRDSVAGQARRRLPGGVHRAQLLLDRLGRGAGKRLGRSKQDAAVPARVRAVRALAPDRAQRDVAAVRVDAGDDRARHVRGAAHQRRRRERGATAGSAPGRSPRLSGGLHERECGAVADGVLARAAARPRASPALARAGSAGRRRGGAGRGGPAERQPWRALLDPGGARARVRAATRSHPHVRRADPRRRRVRRRRPGGAAPGRSHRPPPERDRGRAHGHGGHLRCGAGGGPGGGARRRDREPAHAGCGARPAPAPHRGRDRDRGARGDPAGRLGRGRRPGHARPSRVGHVQERAGLRGEQLRQPPDQRAGQLAL